MTPDSELQYWIAFSRVPTVGRVRVGLLEERFGSLEAAWQAGAGELRASGLDTSVVDAIVETRPTIEPAGELERVRVASVTAITWHDSAYPRLLREIDDLPPVIYMKGALTPEDSTGITVVGTRRPTAYGKEVAHHLAGDLARAGVTVVSGLARGIDGVAHRASLEAGRTDRSGHGLWRRRAVPARTRPTCEGNRRARSPVIRISDGDQARGTSFPPP